MDVLVALGTGITYLYSLSSLTLNVIKEEAVQEQYFETCIFLIFFVILGKFLESYAKGFLASHSRSNIASYYKVASANAK